MVKTTSNTKCNRDVSLECEECKSDDCKHTRAFYKIWDELEQ